MNDTPEQDTMFERLFDCIVNMEAKPITDALDVLAAEFARLNDALAFHQQDHAALVARVAELDEVARLNARVEHLTGLVKQAEWEGHYYTEKVCPWCDAYMFSETHAETCPAFTPGGEVK